MANLSGQPELDDASLETAEARMRRALKDLDTQGPANGRTGVEPGRSRAETRAPERHSGDRPRARFVQDGDVPVTVLHRTRPQEAEAAGGTNRLGVAEAALASERTARLRAERALAETHAAVHDLQTKWGHAELARQELLGRLEAEKAAFDAERAGLQAREQTLTDELAAARAAHAQAELKTARRGAAPQTLVADAVEAKPEMPALGHHAAEGQAAEDQAGDQAAEDQAPVAAGASKAVAKRTGRVGRPTLASATHLAAKNGDAKNGDAKPVKWWLGNAKKK